MKNKLQKFFIGLVILFFSACSLKQDGIDINHYSIDFKTKKINQTAKLKTIFIEKPEVNKSFDLTSIFYNTKPYLFEEYAKNRWINLPSNMIYNQLLDSFTSSNIFTNVISKDSKVDKDYLLKTNVIKLYHKFENEKSYAIINIKFDLLENEKIKESFNFDKKVLCKSNDAYGFVESSNKAFEEIIDELLLKIKSI